MASYPLVVVDGPPRCGKSTLARQLAASSSAGAILARAGSPEGRRIMANPLALSAAQPVILDGASMDEARSLERILAATDTAQSAAPPAGQPKRIPRFVLVGGPFRRQAGWAAADPAISKEDQPNSQPPSQTQPGIALLCLGPLTLAEVGRGSIRTHWLRGGYPEAYAAVSDSTAMANQENLLAGLAGGLLSPWGLPASPTRLAGLLTSLAESSEGLINENRLARMLSTSRPTVCRWIGILEQAGILRQVPHFHGTTGACRTVQSPARHIRDSGLIHSLLGIGSSSDLRSMPRRAAISWRSYVLEQTAVLITPGTALGSYLSADGACIELVLKRDDRILAATTRVHLPGSPGKGTSLAAQALGATDRWLVVPDGTTRNIGRGFRATGLAEFLDEVCNRF